jgi:catechol 2,3-dioxygenase-like lactoylglutathione lyase family enzyme
MALFNQLTHVSVTVTDVAKAREFYSDVLGFREIDRPAFNFPVSGTAWAATCSSTSS